jgi:uncharacterized protein (DUF433 family)
MILSLAILPTPAETHATLETRIVATPGICGGSARIKDSRIPVWGLALARQQGFSDGDLLEMYPHLKPNDLAAAWEYQACHGEEINAEIESNQSV